MIKRLSYIYLFIVYVFLACNYYTKELKEECYLDFVLFDIGQGLSQLFLCQNEAIVFDMGPQDSAKKWLSEYRKIGAPSIKAIVISHRDIDHSGGLCFLDSSVNWNGILISSPLEDTGFLKSQFSKWKGNITIKPITMNDTIFFNNKCFIKCLWPPREIPEKVPISDLNTNHYSLVFHFTYNNTSVLITGDIDSIAARAIAITYKSKLYSDIVIVPHHGSSISDCQLFYNYAMPSFAFLSYGNGNTYGHPSYITLRILALSGIEYFSTAVHGDLFWRSNGYYWVRIDF